MLGVERRQYIYNLLEDKGNISVTELSSLCAVGEETIRRDLSRMSSEGLIEKIYGGAVLRNTMHSVLPVPMRKITAAEGKRKIAKTCAKLIEDGDTIFLDGSTTSMKIAAELVRFRRLVIITNSAEIACIFSENPLIKVICIGGTMRANTRTFVGQSTVNMLQDYFADKVFLCCDGIDMRTGITDANEQEAEVRRAMIDHATMIILAADQSKFDKTSFVSIAEIPILDRVVTDVRLSEGWERYLFDNEVSFSYGE